MKNSLTTILFTLLLSIIHFISIAQTISIEDDFAWTSTNAPFEKSSKAVVTSKGLMVGELNSIYGSDRYNGIAVSNGSFGLQEPFGEVIWERIGLEGYGITDLIRSKEYQDDIAEHIFASTYYTVDNKKGIYHSTDFGSTWKLLNNNFSSSCITYSNGIIFAGGYSHGLWTSSNLGLTWTQRIGSGWYGPKIEDIASNEISTIVALSDSVQISSDLGETWSKLDELSQKTIKYLSSNSEHFIAGSSGNSGLWLSEQEGKKWSNITYFNNKPITSVKGYFLGFFISYYENGYYKISYFSPEQNLIYETGLLSPERINDISIMHTDKNIVLVISDKRIYVSKIPEPVFEENKYMIFPLASMSGPGYTNFMDKINSFFDHEYPLFGYSPTKEPLHAMDTTLNFLGIRDKIPNLYYSSHNGIDFDSDIGEDVLAVAKGKASYYYCKDCGNTIKIDHENGFQSVYMHLNYIDLITKNESVEVIKGQKIGSVGMTGRTTGPHLHFQIIKDVNENGIFSDDFPSGNSDPFGWESLFYKDPWSFYEWEDMNGLHTGTSSEYLWETRDNSKVYYSSASYSGPSEINYSNKKFVLPDNTQSNITYIIKDYKKPSLEPFYGDLKYISNSSILLTAYDLAFSSIKSLDAPLKITTNIKNSIISNVIPGSLSFYFFNEASSEWVKMESVLDTVTQEISTTTDHLSLFAVFGIKKDFKPPITQIVITGSVPDTEPYDLGWHDKAVKVLLYHEDLDTLYGLSEPSSENNNTLVRTYFSIGHDHDWTEYKTPFYIFDTGIHEIRYRSVDKELNYEIANSIVVKIKSDNSRIFQTKIKSTKFSFL